MTTASSRMVLYPRFRGTFEATPTEAYRTGDTVIHENNLYYGIGADNTLTGTPNPTTGQTVWAVLSSTPGQVNPSGTILFFNNSQINALSPTANQALTVGSNGLPEFVNTDTIDAADAVILYQNPIAPNISSLSRPYQNTNMVYLSQGRLFVVGHSYYGETGDRYTSNTPYYQTTPRELTVLEGDVRFDRVFNGAGCWFAIAEDNTQVYAWGLDGGRFGDGSTAVNSVLTPTRIPFFHDDNIQIADIMTFDNWSPRYSDSTTLVGNSSHITSNDQITNTGDNSRLLIAYFLEAGGGQRVFVCGGATDVQDAVGFLDGGTTLNGSISVIDGLTNIVRMGILSSAGSAYFVEENGTIRELNADLSGINAVYTPTDITDTDNAVEFLSTWYDVVDGSDRTLMWINAAGLGHYTLRSPFTGDATTTVFSLTAPNGLNRELHVLGAAGRTILTVTSTDRLYYEGVAEPFNFSAAVADQTAAIRILLPSGVGGVSRIKPVPRFGNTNAGNINTGFHLLTTTGVLLYVGANPALGGTREELGIDVEQRAAIGAPNLRFYAIPGYVGTVVDWDYVTPSRILRIYTSDGYIYMDQKRVTFRGQLNNFDERYALGLFTQTQTRLQSDPTADFGSTGVGGRGAEVQAPIQLPIPRSYIVE